MSSLRHTARMAMPGYQEETSYGHTTHHYSTMPRYELGQAQQPHYYSPEFVVSETFSTVKDEFQTFGSSTAKRMAARPTIMVSHQQNLLADLQPTHPIIIHGNQIIGEQAFENGHTATINNGHHTKGSTFDYRTEDIVQDDQDSGHWEQHIHRLQEPSLNAYTSDYGGDEIIEEEEIHHRVRQPQQSILVQPMVTPKTESWTQTLPVHKASAAVGDSNVNEVLSLDTSLPFIETSHFPPTYWRRLEEYFCNEFSRKGVLKTDVGIQKVPIPKRHVGVNARPPRSNFGAMVRPASSDAATLTQSGFSWTDASCNTDVRDTVFPELLRSRLQGSAQSNHNLVEKLFHLSQTDHSGFVDLLVQLLNSRQEVTKSTPLVAAQQPIVSTGINTPPYMVDRGTRGPRPSLRNATVMTEPPFVRTQGINTNPESLNITSVSGNTDHQPKQLPVNVFAKDSETVNRSPRPLVSTPQTNLPDLKTANQSSPTNIHQKPSPQVSVPPLTNQLVSTPLANQTYSITTERRVVDKTLQHHLVPTTGIDISTLSLEALDNYVKEHGVLLSNDHVVHEYDPSVEIRRDVQGDPEFLSTGFLPTPHSASVSSARGCEMTSTYFAPAPMSAKPIPVQSSFSATPIPVKHLSGTSSLRGLRSFSCDRNTPAPIPASSVNLRQRSGSAQKIPVRIHPMETINMRRETPKPSSPKSGFSGHVDVTGVKTDQLSSSYDASESTNRRVILTKNGSAGIDPQTLRLSTTRFSDTPNTALGSSSVTSTKHTIPPRNNSYQVSEALNEACEALAKCMVSAASLNTTAMRSSMKILKKAWFEVTDASTNNANMMEDFIAYIYSCSWRLLKHVIELQDENDGTCLHYAVGHGAWRVVETILNVNYADVDQFNKAGYTPIMVATLSPESTKGSEDVVGRLFASGKVNSRSLTPPNQTPLIMATKRNAVTLVSMLLAHGALVNMQDTSGNTALMCAVHRGNIEIAKLLLAQQRLDLSLRDNDGRTALDLAVDAGKQEFVKLIERCNSADPEDRSADDSVFPEDALSFLDASEFTSFSRSSHTVSSHHTKKTIMGMEHFSTIES